jgi:hypothetical protein
LNERVRRGAGLASRLIAGSSATRIHASRVIEGSLWPSPPPPPTSPPPPLTVAAARRRSPLVAAA